MRILVRLTTVGKWSTGNVRSRLSAKTVICYFTVIPIWWTSDLTNRNYSGQKLQKKNWIFIAQYKTRSNQLRSEIRILQYMKISIKCGDIGNVLILLSFSLLSLRSYAVHPPICTPQLFAGTRYWEKFVFSLKMYKSGTLQIFFFEWVKNYPLKQNLGKTSMNEIDSTRHTVKFLY